MVIDMLTSPGRYILVAIGVLLSLAVADLKAQAPRFPSLPKSKSPYLKPQSYSGPPLSMALSRSALAVSTARNHRSTTGHAINSSRLPTLPVAPNRPYPNFKRQSSIQPFFSVPHYDGKSVSRYAISTTLSRGLQF